MLDNLVSRNRRAAFVGIPETIVRRHRALVRPSLTYPHRRPGRPALPNATVELMVRLARRIPAGATCGSSANRTRPRLPGDRYAATNLDRGSTVLLL